MKPKSIPDGYHSITPYFAVSNAAKAIEFYTKAFGAKERLRMPGPDGKIMHAELQIGDSTLMLADEFPEMGHKSPTTLGGSPVSIMLYVQDVDATFKQATSCGAEISRPVENQFYGDRMGTLRDPFGHTWSVATHVEDVSPEEMERRMKAYKPK